jgi:hypothetical protein
MIERDGKDKQSAYFTDLHHYGSTHLLENNAYLPLGFLADPKLGTLEFGENANVFRFQNKLFTAATGITEAVWWMFGGDDLVITGDNVTVTDENSSGYCAYSKGVANSAVTYTYTAHQDGFMCVNLNLPKRNKVSISVNGVELYSETMSLPQMLAVGDVSVGDEITVRMTCKANESGTMSLSAAILNQERFFRGYAFLAENTWELTSFHNTRIAGTVDCSRDGLLYTSVPQNGNWHAYVDGKEVPITLVGDAMVAVELTQGTHTVTLVYRNTAFILGTMISLVSAAAFIGAYLLVYKPKTLKKIRKTEER